MTVTFHSHKYTELHWDQSIRTSVHVWIPEIQTKDITVNSLHETLIQIQNMGNASGMLISTFYIFIWINSCKFFLISECEIGMITAWRGGKKSMREQRCELYNSLVIISLEFSHLRGHTCHKLFSVKVVWKGLMNCVLFHFDITLDKHICRMNEAKFAFDLISCGNATDLFPHKKSSSQRPFEIRVRISRRPMSGA